MMCSYSCAFDVHVRYIYLEFLSQIPLKRSVFTDVSHIKVNIFQKFFPLFYFNLQYYRQQEPPPSICPIFFRFPLKTPDLYKDKHLVYD